MKLYEEFKLLNDSTVSKFLTRKWMEVNDLLNGQYSANTNVRFKTPLLTSDLCDFSDAYIVMKMTIKQEAGVNDDMPQDIGLKNNAPFRLRIAKINGILMGNSEDLDIVMLMYHMLEYNYNYSIASGSLWNYCRVEIVDNDDDSSKFNSLRIRQN